MSADLRNADLLRGLDRDQFADQAAIFFGRLNSIHPFREDNGRAQRAFITSLAENAGHTLAFEVVSRADIIRQLDEESKKPGAVAHSEGDVEKALAEAAQRVDAIYQVPFLAHAALEPMNCTVHVRDDGCDIWVGTQVLTRAQAVVAAVTGLPKEAIKVHNHLIGGAFGRRLEVDGIAHAVKVAQQVDGPVKVVWSREEDIQRDMYRPYYYDRLSAALDTSGMPVAWTHRFSGSSILARYFPAAFQNGIDPDAVDGAAELAAAATQDPVAYRQKLLGHNPRVLGVLALAAEKAGWGEPLPARHGRGISVQSAFGSYVSLVAEVEVTADGAVKVRRVVCAVDCGLVVNPDTIAAQMEGGAIFGLTAVLHGAITLKDGRVEQGNFDTYLPMRIDEVPVVETHLIASAEAPGGIGETATVAIGPAVTNAIFAATGKRIRTLPIDPELLKT